MSYTLTPADIEAIRTAAKHIKSGAAHAGSGYQDAIKIGVTLLGIADRATTPASEPGYPGCVTCGGTGLHPYYLRDPEDSAQTGAFPPAVLPRPPASEDDYLAEAIANAPDCDACGGRGRELDGKTCHTCGGMGYL